VLVPWFAHFAALALYTLASAVLEPLRRWTDNYYVHRWGVCGGGVCGGGGGGRVHRWGRWEEEVGGRSAGGGAGRNAYNHRTND
jgi:hypothetical protein